jgi:hypothetical protein
MSTDEIYPVRECTPYTRRRFYFTAVAVLNFLYAASYRPYVSSSPVYMHLEFPEARQVAGRPAAPSRRCKFAIALLFPTPDHLRDELGHSESATTAGSRSKQI